MSGCARGYHYYEGLFLYLRTICVVATTFMLTACYTVKQGYHQAKLLMKRQSLEEVLKTGSETPERLQKLRAVAEARRYATSIGLNPCNSYTTYVALENPYVTWIVQAAERRALKWKTWWFPLVGSQPYLGFFVKGEAEEFFREMSAAGYDVVSGGVRAFSMLGYISDPVYSSMIDGSDLAGVVELILHESVHATIYLPGFSSFNENLADFVAREATARYLTEKGLAVPDSQARFAREQAAQKKFKEFLVSAKSRLEGFYQEATTRPELANDELFLAERKKLFDLLANDYAIHMAGIEKGTNYEWSFRKGKINNAVVLGYSLYEAKQQPFAVALAAANNNLPLFLKRLKHCLRSIPKNEDALWQKVEMCNEGDEQ